MQPNKKKRAFSDAILLEVKKEMAKPRIVESARREVSVSPGKSDERFAQRVKPGRLSGGEKSRDYNLGGAVERSTL
jgi:hypothetical protein